MASGLIDRALLGVNEALEDSSFKRLFTVWKRLNEKLSDSGEASEDVLIDAQSRLMAVAAHLPAKSFEDALYKLAFWRWDSADLGKDFEELQRGDQIIYSVFRDLAALVGAVDVLTEADRNSEILSARAS